MTIKLKYSRFLSMEIQCGIHLAALKRLSRLDCERTLSFIFFQNSKYINLYASGFKKHSEKDLELKFNFFSLEDLSKFLNKNCFKLDTTTNIFGESDSLEPKRLYGIYKDPSKYHKKVKTRDYSKN